jgi:hypothetical protein
VEQVDNLVPQVQAVVRLASTEEVTEHLVEEEAREQGMQTMLAVLAGQE